MCVFGHMRRGKVGPSYNKMIAHIRKASVEAVKPHDSRLGRGHCVDRVDEVNDMWAQEFLDSG